MDVDGRPARCAARYAVVVWCGILLPHACDPRASPHATLQKPWPTGLITAACLHLSSPKERALPQARPFQHHDEHQNQVSSGRVPELVLGAMILGVRPLRKRPDGVCQPLSGASRASPGAAPTSAQGGHLGRAPAQPRCQARAAARRARHDVQLQADPRGARVPACEMGCRHPHREEGVIDGLAQRRRATAGARRENGERVELRIETEKNKFHIQSSQLYSARWASWGSGSGPKLEMSAQKRILRFGTRQSEGMFRLDSLARCAGRGLRL